LYFIKKFYFLKLPEKININKLLIPVDFSEGSLQASRFAFKIADKAKAEVMFFHSLYSPAFDLIELSGTTSTRKSLKEDVKNKLVSDISIVKNQFIDSLKNFPELKDKKESEFKFHFTAGLVKEEILTFSDEYQPDIVIMGTRGKNNSINAFLGSVTEYAIKELSFPVLAIPENYIYINDAHFNNIIYLTDFDESDFLSIRRLMGFTKLFGLAIHCIHIGSRENISDNLKMEGLKDYFHKAYKNQHVECKTLTPLEKQNKIAFIDNYVRENNIGMIALTARKRNLIDKYFKPNLAKNLFYQSNIPLLVFHS
jgi:nucleotide-binding universal stress UspA family protein